jgi:hypothetical protein
MMHPARWWSINQRHKYIVTVFVVSPKREEERDALAGTENRAITARGRSLNATRL